MIYRRLLLRRATQHSLQYILQGHKRKIETTEHLEEICTEECGKKASVQLEKTEKAA